MTLTHRPDFIDLPAVTHASGTVRLPGSKSITNRALLLAGLCPQPTTLRGVLESDDTQVMREALQQLGVRVQSQGTTWQLQGTTTPTLGTAEAPLKIFLGNAGTAMRPLTAALALLGAHAELSGVPRMHQRPIGDLVQALQAMGASVHAMQQDGYPPLRVAPAPINLSQPVRVRGDVSSQFLTALLMALPLARSASDVVIDVQGELISKPYVGITLAVMQAFGVTLHNDNWQRFVLPRGSAYRSPGTFDIEPDASAASYFLALGALAASPSQPLCIQGLGEDALQGDIRFIDAVRAMGAQVQATAHGLAVWRDAWPLRALTLDCTAIPDAAMTLVPMAMLADGPSTLTGIGSWRVKETDRIAAMANEARALGATVACGEDWLRIDPVPTGQWQRAAIHTYDDHRVAMCFALAACNPDRLGLRLLDPACVGKTFPNFFSTWFDVAHSAPGSAPVICIDGPSASGKGTLAARLAQALGYHLLDSGALYRLVGLAAQRAGLDVTPQGLASSQATQAVTALAAQLNVRFAGQQTWLDGDDVTEAIRSEQAGYAASVVSALPQVRQALLQRQRDMARAPGLVADGRDMGTVVFPQAPLKVFLTASAQARAQRRHKQLISRGISATLLDLLADLEARDARDTQRAHAPLKPAADALQLDNSALDIETSVQQVLAWWQDAYEAQRFGAAPDSLPER